LRSYNIQLENNEQHLNSPFPIAIHSQEENIPTIGQNEIVIPNNDFDIKFMMRM